MPTVLVRDVLWRASGLLQDTKPQFYRHAEADMVDALNDTQVALAKFLPSACSRVDTLRLAPGTKQSIASIAPASCKPGDGSTPSTPIQGTQVLDVIRNMGADGLAAGRTIRLVPGKVMDAQNRDWHTEAGTAVKAYVYDPATPRYFWVWPGAHPTTPVWVDVSYTADPLRIPPGAAEDAAAVYGKAGSNTLTISVADEYIDELVYYVVARMLYRPSEWADAQKGDRFTALFTTALNAKVQALTGVNPNIRHLPMASGQTGPQP